MRQIPTQNDSDWILRQIENRADSEWTLRQISEIKYDSDWTLRQISGQISEIKYDSDWIMSQIRHVDNFKTFTYAPSIDVASGGSYDTGVTISDYPDIDVFLNGVLVTQYTTATTLFTFNFVLRANTDVVIIKMRK